jgi:hypothetical protein
MTTRYILNAAPMTIDQGVQDLSTMPMPIVPEAVPQHLPKFYLYTQKGPITPQLVVGNSRINTYGVDSFDLRKKYANHATVFANLVDAEANACMIERMQPVDAGPDANFILSLDVLPTLVPVTQRDASGAVMLNASGVPISTSTTPGFKVKFVVSFDSTGTAFGLATTVAGDQTDTTVTPTVTSQRYPIFEGKVSSFGDWGNNSGVRLWAPTTDKYSNFPSEMMNTERAYPYYISVINRKDIYSSAVVKSTLFGDNYVKFCLKPNAIDPVTDAQMYLPDVFLSSYQNNSNPLIPYTFADIGDLFVYQANIDTLLAQFIAAEVPFIGQFSDFTTDPADYRMFNFISGCSSQDVLYQSYNFVDAANSIRLTDITNVYAQGGADGTMSDTLFAGLVSAAVTSYADPMSELQDIATNVESIIYDSGFPLTTKYDLCSFIAERKDTFVILSVYQAGQAPMLASEEYSTAIALRTRLQMYPESDYFGTPIVRGMIMGRCGTLRNSVYKGTLPVTAEVAIKSARYMGASNGQWKTGLAFDSAPGSVLEYMDNVNISYVPASVRNINWSVGLNWVLKYDRRSLFFPALKTAYNDDTSILNSYFTAMAVCQLNKIAHSCWREYSGVSSLTPAQLIQKVNTYVSNKVYGIFDNRFVIVPMAFMSDMDTIRGFSWTLPIKIYGDNMDTVMTTSVQAYRMSALTNTTAP